MSKVYPVSKNTFKFGTNGLESETTAMASVADMESFSVAYDNNVETWNPMEADGWQRALMTGKTLTISFSGKRSYGDEGNDYIAGLAFKNGNDASTKFEWTMPDGTKVAGNVVIDVKSNGGDSTAVDALEFDAIFDGKPTVTPKTV